MIAGDSELDIGVEKKIVAQYMMKIKNFPDEIKNAHMCFYRN